MKLKAAPGIVEIFPLFAPKTFNNGNFIEFTQFGADCHPFPLI